VYFVNIFPYIYFICIFIRNQNSINTNKTEQNSINSLLDIIALAALTSNLTFNLTSNLLIRFDHSSRGKLKIKTKVKLTVSYNV